MLLMKNERLSLTMKSSKAKWVRWLDKSVNLETDTPLPFPMWVMRRHLEPVQLTSRPLTKAEVTVL